MSIKAIIKRLNWIDWGLETLGFIGIVLIIYYAITTYPLLPEIIPKHWDYKGYPDEYGSRINFLTMPIIALIVYIGWTILLEYSQTKTQAAVTSSATIIQYSRFFRLFRLLKTGLIAFWLYDVYKHNTVFLGREPIIKNISLFILTMLTAIIGIIIFSSYRLRK